MSTICSGTFAYKKGGNMKSANRSETCTNKCFLKCVWMFNTIELRFWVDLSLLMKCGFITIARYKIVIQTTGRTDRSAPEKAKIWHQPEK